MNLRCTYCGFTHYEAWDERECTILTITRLKACLRLAVDALGKEAYTAKNQNAQTRMALAWRVGKNELEGARKLYPMTDNPLLTYALSLSLDRLEDHEGAFKERQKGRDFRW